MNRRPSRPFPASTLKEALRSQSRSRREGLVRAHGADTDDAKPRNDLLPHLEVTERSTADLKPPGRNVRRCEAAHVREVANAISTFGFTVPVLIGDGDQVLDGWIRVLAARELGLPRIPCIPAAHLSPTEQRAIRIALNRLGEGGRWDLAELRIELGELVLDDAPIEVLGFTPPQLDQLLLDEDAESIEQGPLEPRAPPEIDIRLGDIFQLGAHRIACGDCRDENLLKQLMAGDVARLVLTDVPYNVPVAGHVTGGDHREFAMASGEMSAEEFLAFNRAWMKAAGAHLEDGGVLGTFIDWRGYPTIHDSAQGESLEALNLVVWSKTNAGMGSLYRSAYELLPLFKKGRAAHVNNVALGRHGRWRSNVWVYPGASSLGSDAREGLKSHPTVKPTAMLEDALLDLTQRGEVVLDPFLGSGSTLLASEKAGRRCRGVEIDPAYVDLAIRRFESLTDSKAERLNRL